MALIFLIIFRKEIKKDAWYEHSCLYSVNLFYSFVTYKCSFK